MRGSSRAERAHETKSLRLRFERRRGSEELFVHDTIVHVQKQLCSPRDGRRTPRLLKEAVAPATPPMWTCSSLRERSRKGTEPLDGKREGQPQHGSLPIPLLAVLGGRSDGLLGAAGKEWAVAHQRRPLYGNGSGLEERHPQQIRPSRRYLPTSMPSYAWTMQSASLIHPKADWGLRVRIQQHLARPQGAHVAFSNI